MKSGDMVLCGPDCVRARVVRVSSAPRRSSDSELIPRRATIVVCEMPWGAHWAYW
jgi:poly-gamma-glutamate capsule biosynthesis protein CapA/YwtB (metallophosphatase superfamily)